MRTEVRVLTDTVNDGHITDAHLNVWINQGLRELVGTLSRIDPDRYYVTTDLNTTAGTLLVALPSNFHQMRRVDWLVGTQTYPIEPFSLQEPPYLDPYASPGNPYADLRYRVMAQALYFNRDPGAGTVRIHYTQAPITLSLDGSSFDGVMGWEDWIVMFAAARVRVRNDEDASFELAEMARIEDKIKSEASNRDAGRAPRIADVRPRYGARSRGWA
jgi:hypothetical protein